MSFHATHIIVVRECHDHSNDFMGRLINQVCLPME